VYSAEVRLATEWDILIDIAREIVSNALQSKEVEVRGLTLGSISIVPQIITKEVGATLYPGSLISSKFHDMEMEWNCFLKYGRKIIPSWVKVHEYATSKNAAIDELLESGVQPGKTIPWQTFCDAVRDRADGWASEREKRPKRGFSDRTIARLVRRQTGKALRRHR
jgi:hypothetical protein